MCDCDGDGPSVFNQDDRKARKPHRCSECRRTIAKGETYLRISGLWDGRWSAFAWCDHCEATRIILDQRLKDFCFCYGQFWEAVEEANQYSSQFKTRVESFAVARLCVAARRKWTIRRGPHKGSPMPVPVVPMAIPA